MTGLMIVYEINPSFAQVTVERILDIRPISYDDKGVYELPSRFDKYHFARQLGVVPKGDKALICIQPPGIYIPDFGYGPINRRVVVRESKIQLPGGYEKFPELPRFKTLWERELTEDGMPYIGLKNFDAIQSHTANGVTEKDIEKLMANSDFSAALESLFKSVGFEIPLPVQA